MVLVFPAQSDTTRPLQFIAMKKEINQRPVISFKKYKSIGEKLFKKSKSIK